MSFKKLKSWAKVNLSLNVIRRLPSNYHKIESLITFVQFSDEIKIKSIDAAKHKISFLGKFSKGIGTKNTVIKLLNLLEKKKLIKNKKFEIKVTKNIPQKSGMGGGSMNAACILKYLIKKKNCQYFCQKGKRNSLRSWRRCCAGPRKKKFNIIKKWENSSIKQQIEFLCFNRYAKIWMFY